MFPLTKIFLGMKVYLIDNPFSHDADLTAKLLVWTTEIIAAMLRTAFGAISA